MPNLTYYIMTQLYSSNYNKILHQAYLITRCIQTAEDIVQDSFIILLNELKKGNPIINKEVYLQTICRHQSLNYLKRQRNYKRIIKEFGIIKNFVENNDPLETKQLNECLKKAISILPQRQKISYYLKRECNWKRDAIAEVIGCSDHTVRNNLNAALHSIREAYINYLN